MSTPELLKPTALCPETWKSILWRESQRIRKHVFGIVTFFVAAFMIIPIDPMGVGLLVATLIAGQYLAVSLGGGDVLESSEHYAFILPLRRADYFCSRYLAGLCLLVGLVSISYLMNRFDLHRHFWGIFCESGLADARWIPYPKLGMENYILCAIIAYSNTYCLAASARQSNLLIGSWFLGMIATYGFPAILISSIAYFYELRPEKYLYGATFVILSSVIALALLAYVFPAYSGKNAVSNEDRKPAGLSIFNIILIVFAVIILVSAFVS